MKRAISEDPSHTRSEPHGLDQVIENEGLQVSKRLTTRALIDPSMVMNLVPEATQESYMLTEHEPGQPEFLPTEQQEALQ